MSKISIVLPDLRFGGAERLHLNLAEYWSKSGHDVEFILMREEGEYLSLVYKKITIISLGVYRFHQILFPLMRYFRTSKPDFILVAMWPLTSYSIISWMLSGKIGKMFVSDHVNLSIAVSRELHISKLYLKNSIRFIYPFASGIIAVSKGVKKDLCSIGCLDDKQVEVIYNPIAIGIRTPKGLDKEREKLWGKEHTYNILSVGEFKKQKDHETLIRSFSLLPKNMNTKLIILGEGHLRKKLFALIKRLNLESKIDLPGFVHDPYPWYRTSDLFVLSSQWEGFGNVIVEALECGIPIVSTNCPSGPSEILDNGRYGRLVPVGDAIELAAAIVSSLSAEHDTDTLKKRAQDFSVEKISNKYLDFFKLVN
jgi:glycosyltransferase involved in cell wall biosynthesis